MAEIESLASEDTLQRVLSLVLERVGPEGALIFSQVCKPWRRELEALGFCTRTFQLCAALVDGEDLRWRGFRLQRKLRRLTKRTGRAEQVMWMDVNALVQRPWGWTSSATFHEWLQAASQEPAASFLSRGAASTAQILGFDLVHWVGKPQGRYPGVFTLAGYRGNCTLRSVSLSPDGTRILCGSNDGLVRICNAATGDEVSSFVRGVEGRGEGGGVHFASGLRKG